MRNLVLVLIALIAVVTFIRAYEPSGDQEMNNTLTATMESGQDK